jgi:hypothetical protein
MTYFVIQLAHRNKVDDADVALKIYRRPLAIPLPASSRLLGLASNLRPLV